MAEVWVPPPFDDISTTELVSAAQLSALGNSLRFLKEVSFVAFASDVPVTATSVGTANQVASAGAITYENVPHMIEFFCPRYSAPAQVTNIILRDSTTVLGTLSTVNASSDQTAVHVLARVTPTAAAHTYNVAAWLGGAGTGTMQAGTGGTAGNSTTFLGGFIRVYRVPT